MKQVRPITILITGPFVLGLTIAVGCIRALPELRTGLRSRGRTRTVRKLGRGVNPLRLRSLRIALASRYRGNCSLRRTDAAMMIP
jgi:hypothetical protein